MYNFKTAPNRKDHGSRKWAMMYDYGEISDEIRPLSVADMEFVTAPEIAKGLSDYLKEVVLGYSQAYDEYYQAVIDYQRDLHGFHIEKEWIVLTPGVVNGFTAAINSLTQEGEGVIIFRPIYPPMGNCIVENNRVEVALELINRDGHYEIDFESFEKACQDKNNKVLLFCSPHNPVGRVWTREELEKIGEICLANDIKIISDEIWQDVVMPGHEHMVIAKLSPELSDITITCTAPSKTYNIAGLATSNIIISNEKIRADFKKSLEKMKSHAVNILGYKACEIAYNDCRQWREQMLEVIASNRDLVEDFFEKYKLPVTKLEGTYVMWVNMAPLGMNREELYDFLYKEAKFFVTPGYSFGQGGEGFIRINIGLPTESLKIQLDRLGEKLDQIGGK